MGQGTRRQQNPLAPGDALAQLPLAVRIAGDVRAGAATGVDELTVIWPDGSTQKVGPVKADARNVIQQNAQP